MKLVLVTPNNLEEYWLKTRKLIEAACTRSFNKYQAVDIMRELMKGRMNLWVTEDDKIHSLAITQIVSFPRTKVCKILCCTGKGMNEWVHYLMEIEMWAKAMGCSTTEPECRKGWARVLKKMGYKPAHVMLIKDLA